MDIAQLSSEDLKLIELFDLAQILVCRWTVDFKPMNCIHPSTKVSWISRNHCTNKSAEMPCPFKEIIVMRGCYYSSVGGPPAQYTRPCSDASELLHRPCKQSFHGRPSVRYERLHNSLSFCAVGSLGVHVCMELHGERSMKGPKVNQRN